MGEQKYFLIIGNGIAGATAAETLRAEDQEAHIMVVANDPSPVYYRPALKDYLAGKIREDKLWARPINFYPDRNIHFLTDTVVSIDPQGHNILLHTGRQLNYTKLLLAHGARASTLTCPGAALLGVTPLRTIADYQQVLSLLNQVRRVVVTGSGTLALETIETLRHRGFAVTHLLRRRTLWSDVLDPIASDLVLQQEQRDGVDVRTEQEITEILGRNGRVTGVVTTTGDRIACELVLQGIGIDPIIDCVKAAGIACGRGVKVDETMSTNMPDIYAAGDLIETNDSLTNKTRVIGQWYPSIQQARAAAYTMLGMLDTQHMFRFGNFYNATMLYGLDFASVGLSILPKGGKDYIEIQADPVPRHYQKVILKAGVPVGMLGIGDRSSVLTYKRAIDHGINVSPIAHRLFDPDFKLDAWLDQQGVPPAILGIQKIQRTQKTLTQSQSAKSAAPPMENKAPVRGAISQPDGSLLLPGNNKVLSAQLFKQTRQGPTLILVTPDSSKVFPLVPETKISIGREKTCDIQLNDITISRRHAEIFSTPSGFHIRDLGSSNGVKVNQTRIANAYHLSSGDCITLSNNVNIYFTSPSVSQPLPRLVQPKQQVTNSITTLTAIAPPATANGQACPGCGKNCPVNARFCANCGRTL